MPKITIVNSNANAPITLQEKQSGYSVEVPAGATKTVAVDDNILRSLEAQLNAEQTAGKITWSSAPDAAEPADQGAIGKKYVSGVRAATGALETIAHGLGVAPTLVIIQPVVSPGSYAALSVVEGVHTTTNLLITVASGWSYKVIALV